MYREVLRSLNDIGSIVIMVITVITVIMSEGKGRVWIRSSFARQWLDIIKRM